MIEYQPQSKALYILVFIYPNNRINISFFLDNLIIFPTEQYLCVEGVSAAFLSQCSHHLGPYAYLHVILT